MVDDCQCEFDRTDDPDSYHYRRTCLACGKVWFSLHCEHDGYQRPCVHCSERPKVIE